MEEIPRIMGTRDPQTYVQFRCSSRNTLSSSWWRSWKRHTPEFPKFNYLLLIFVLIGALIAPSASGFGIGGDYKPNSIVTLDELVYESFHGNNSHTDYFRLLQRDGNSLLIGARNIVYNISLFDLSEHFDRRIVWNSRQEDSKVCFLKGKTESECHNYIRVLAKKRDGELLVCGTNAYKPLCRDYTLQPNGTFTYVESSGTAKCPYNPRHNSTFVYADGELYSGTAGDFQETLSLIYRDPLRTEPTDYKHLNAPNFVHSFEYNDYVFFFLREVAVEYMNCGKKVYSRVARVCKQDQGNRPRKSHALWTSFLKSRFNCSVSGDFPFYFDEIQSATDVIRGDYGGGHKEMIYAVFTTPPNSIPGSAICAFSMKDIQDTFEGSFLEQKDMSSNWLSVPPHLVPEPRPGSCVNNSRTLPEVTTNFVLSHPLMSDMVPSFNAKPLIMKASFNFRFTKVAVDPQVPVANEAFADVIFTATDAGIILKTFNSPVLEEGASSPIVEEIHAFDKSVAINNLQVTKLSNGQTKVILITDSEVRALPLHRCHKAKSCSECVALQDPYCGWYPNSGICSSFQNAPAKEIVLQNISSGLHSSCPYNDENLINTKSSTQIYTTETPSPPTSPQEGEATCPPCACADAPQTSLSSSTNSPLVPSPHGGGRHPILSEEVLQQNEIESDSPRDIITNYISLLPEETHPRKRLDPKYANAVRSGKELPIAEGIDGRTSNEAASYPPQDTATGPVVGASMKGPLIYSAETLAIAVTTACVAALVVGFISGFLFSRRCRGDDYPPFSDTPHLDSKLNKCDNLVPSADPNMYTANNSLFGAKHINNLVTNYNPKNVNNGKANTNTTTTDNKLLKPAKCAYI